MSPHRIRAIDSRSCAPSRNAVADWRPAGGNLVLEGDDVAILRLNRPDVLNALTLEMLADLAAGIRKLGTGRRSKAVILTGTGRAFSSGDDLKVTEDLDRATWERLIDAFQDVTRAMAETEVAVIAALNGIAVGGAAEIACACDLRVGGPASDFLFPENGLGLTISNGSTLTLPALVGPRAVCLVLLGERIPARRALELGLIDVWVDEPDRVLAEARRVAGDLAEEGMATALHLSMLRPSREDVERALQRERRAALDAWDRELPQRGIRRFFETRGR
jgi:enoyl-CoA hydratase/carnithine racemase